MGTAIGDILPLAIGVALSPLPIVAVILMLFSKNARSTSLGFLIGWFLGVTIVASVVVFASNPAQQATGGEDSPLTAIIHLALGLLLLFLAYRDWRKRPKPGEEVAMPKWMSSIDSMTTGKALVLGALLSGVNPKNLALIVGAGVAIASAGLTSTQTIIILIIFILLCCVTVAAPVVIYLVMGDKATPTLNSWKAWLVHNNAVVMMVILFLFGVKLLADGLGALIGG
jgi:threonine/homoserine/homoserine lactone efflux protein